MAKRLKSVSTSKELQDHFNKLWQEFTPAQRAKARKLITAARRASKKCEACIVRQEEAWDEQDEAFGKLAKFIGVRPSSLDTLDLHFDDDDED